ncbi:MAG: lysylphosphatidylglycerol synthase transmembrane domain-containing protein [Polyangiales bacterium]
MTASTKNGLKALAAIAALGLATRKVDFRALGVALASMPASTIAWMMVLVVLLQLLGAARWWRLLRRLGERPSFAALNGDLLVGMTYNLFLPTTIGGDVVRIWRARARLERPHAAWSTAIYERIAGFVALTGMGALSLALASIAAPGAIATVPFAVRAAVALAAIGFVLLFLVAAAPLRWLVRRMEVSLPAASATDGARAIVADLEGPLASHACRAEAVAWSTGCQLVSLVFLMLAEHAMGEKAHDLAIVVGVPIVVVVSMAPITLGGHGLREGLFVVVLGMLGVTREHALALAILWLGWSVLLAVAGAIVAVVDRSPRGIGRDVDDRVSASSTR